MTIYLGGFEKISVDFLSSSSPFNSRKCWKCLFQSCNHSVKKGGGKKLSIADESDWTNHKIRHWTLRCRLVWVGIYYSLLTRGECDTEFLRFQIKHKQCLPAVMCSALLCMVFAKKSVIVQVIPQRRGKQGHRTPPASPHTKAQILTVLHFCSSWWGVLPCI